MYQSPPHHNTQSQPPHTHKYHCNHTEPLPKTSCHKIADKYCEYDPVIIFLDLFLHRPQAYRHLLFNRMDYRESGIGIQYVKVLVVYIFFEAYIKWFRLKEYCEYTQPKSAFYYYGFWQDHLPHDRYWFILATALAEFAIYVLGISLAVRLSLGSQYAIVKYNYLLMAIILSSFGKGILILMMIWNYTFSFSTILNIFVLTSNVVAIKGMLICLPRLKGYYFAIFLATMT